MTPRNEHEVIIGQTTRVKSMSGAEVSDSSVMYRDLSLRALIGEHYDSAWWWDGRYLVIKGS